MSEGRKIKVRIDWFTVALYFMMVIVGWLFIHSARFDEVLEQNILEFGGTGYEAGKQFIWIIINLGVIVAIFVIDFKFYQSSAYIIYIGMMVILAGVLAFGTEVNGAKSWYQLGSTRIQPAEFGKFATALALAKFISERNLKYNFTFNFYMKLIARRLRLSTDVVSFKLYWDFIIACAVFCIPVVLILLQTDAGSALIYIGAFLLVMYSDGLPAFIPLTVVTTIALFVLALIYKNVYIYLGIGIAALSAFLILRKSIYNTLGIIIMSLAFTGIVYSSYTLFNELPPHQQTRITVLTGAEKKLRRQIDYYTFLVRTVENKDKKSKLRSRLRDVRQKLYDLKGGPSYNIDNSEIAISHGGMWGQGYMQGILTKGDHVPEQHTDFIFSTIGEEMGLFGTVLIVVLYVTFFFRLIHIAERQKSRFAKIYAYGVLGIFFMHFMVNIGMTIRLFPVVGIPLPCISYGGSSLLSFTILLFILLKLDMHRGQLLKRNS